MIPDTALPTLRRTCRTLQVIVLALATRVCNVRCRRHYADEGEVHMGASASALPQLRALRPKSYQAAWEPFWTLLRAGNALAGVSSSGGVVGDQ